jgi:hypothetical protein
MAPRTSLCCLALLVLAGCGSEEPAGERTAPDRAAPATQLTVRVDPDGDGPERATSARISCSADTSDRACAAAAGLRPKDFEPASDDVACTQQYGGPQTATVEGTLERRAVAGRFSREDGCAIARWDKLAPLLEAAGG